VNLISQSFQKIRQFIIPVKENNYHPYALRRTALFAYSVFLITTNTFGGYFSALTIPQVSAADISTSRLIQLANQERSANGLVNLKTNSKLTSAARDKANDMFKKGYWAHYGPDGETPWQFILGSGYSYIYAGENLAKDFVTTDAVHSAWMASPTHRANILKGQYRDVGMAAVTGNFKGEQTTIVVQMFGTTSSSASDNSDPSNTLPTTGSTAKPSSAVLDPPVFTQPQNGAVYKNNLLNIQGTVSNDGKEIVFYDKGVKIGAISADGGAFDYKPTTPWTEGDHALSGTVTAKTTGSVSKKSSEINFEIDTVVPIIFEDSVNVTSENKDGKSTIKISFNTSPDVTQAFLAISAEEYPLQTISLSEDKSTTLISGEVEVALVDLEAAADEGKLIVRDKALNEKALFVDLSAVQGQTQGVYSVLSTSTNSVARVLSQVSSLSFISKVNILVASFVSIIFILDAFVLWKMGVMREGARSALSTFMFVAVILIGVFIGTGGALI
jgi:uncharacterized protein YkwD